MYRVKDPIKSLEFYCDVLGFTLIMYKEFPQWEFNVYVRYGSFVFMMVSQKTKQKQQEGINLTTRLARVYQRRKSDVFRFLSLTLSFYYILFIVDIITPAIL